MGKVSRKTPLKNKQKLLGKVSRKAPSKGLNELEGAPNLPAWSTDTMAGDPAAILDCKETLRVKPSTKDGRDMKGDQGPGDSV